MGIFYGKNSERWNTYATPDGGNTGRYPLGHSLVLPDGRIFRFGLNDGTAEVAGNLYQSVTVVADHTNKTCDVARAIGAVVVSATLDTVAAAQDIYTEGMVFVNDATGEGYNYKIKRAYVKGDANASAATSAVLTVNLEEDEKVQIALVAGTSEVSFVRNRFHQVLIHPSAPTSELAGVAAVAAAANRYAWYQTKGPAAVLVDGTLVIGEPCCASNAVDGAVEPLDEDATVQLPVVGDVIRISATTEYGLIRLNID